MQIIAADTYMHDIVSIFQVCAYQMDIMLAVRDVKKCIVINIMRRRFEELPMSIITFLIDGISHVMCSSRNTWVLPFV